MRNFSVRLIFSKVAIIVALVLPCTSLHAQVVKAKALFTHTSLPDVSAANMLEVENNRVIRPSSLNDVTVQASKFFGLLGGGDGGFAIELNPHLLLSRDKVASELRSIFSGVTLSLATNTAGGASRHAFGIKYSSRSEGDIDTIMRPITNAAALGKAQELLFSIALRMGSDYDSIVAVLTRLYSVPVDSAVKVLGSVGITKTGSIGTIETMLGNEAEELTDKITEVYRSKNILLKEDGKVKDLLGSLTNLIKNGREAILPAIQDVKVNVAEIQDSMAAKNWSSPGWAAGAGFVGISDSVGSGQPTTSRLDYAVAYFSGVVRPRFFGESLILCIQGRGLWGGQTVLDRRPVRSIQGLAQLVFGTNVMRGLAQASIDHMQFGQGYVGTANAPATAQNIARLELGLECRVSDGIWLYSTAGMRWMGNQQPSPVTDIGIRYSPTIGAATFGELIGKK